MVTAKVYCRSKTLWGHQTDVSFTVDYQDGRNKEWAAATPTLELKMGLRPDVADHFTLGGSYTLTFEEEELPEAAS